MMMLRTPSRPSTKKSRDSQSTNAIIFIILLLILKMTNKTSDATVMSDLTGGSKSVGTAATSRSSSSSGEPSRVRRKWNNQKHVPFTTDIFTGSNLNLQGKVFIMGMLQASQYDEAYKAIMTYFGMTYDHRVQCAFEHKDASIGLNMLTKPPAPMIDKVVQVATLGDDSKLRGEIQSVINKDGEEYITYQIELKQYINDVAKYRHNLENVSVSSWDSVTLLWSNPSSDRMIATIKSSSDSIALMKILERIFYNYQSHEYPPLGS